MINTGPHNTRNNVNEIWNICIATISLQDFEQFTFFLYSYSDRFADLNLQDQTLKNRFPWILKEINSYIMQTKIICLKCKASRHSHFETFISRPNMFLAIYGLIIIITLNLRKLNLQILSIGNALMYIYILFTI